LNEIVHSEMLKQAVLGRPGFSYYNIITARVIRELVLELYFASDLEHKIQLIDAVDIGTTADIIRCYTILEAIRVKFNWVEETFAP
jgi:hypothetical protein